MKTNETKPALTEEQKRKKAAKARQDQALPLAMELFKSRYEESLIAAARGDFKDRSGFEAKVIADSERSIEDAHKFFAAWKRKKGLFVAEY